MCIGYFGMREPRIARYWLRKVRGLIIEYPVRESRCSLKSPPSLLAGGNTGTRGAQGGTYGRYECY